MSGEPLFRVVFGVILLGAVLISGTFRRRARQTEAIARAQEGPQVLALRLLFAAPLYVSLFGYLIIPRWMAWSSLPLPEWLRWVGVAAGLVMLPAIYWVMSSIGSNVSETYLTKEHHALVTRGPYRWIRHPLYTVALAVFLSLGLIAANWFMLVMVLVGLAAIALLVVPREEAELLRKFGGEYETYRQRTGRFLPRLSS
jgi:protein-S-isoprenylcysteine O-methyltransferase Ste14